MVKVYLFHKLSALSQMQRDVYDEAVTGVLEQILRGSISTIFNYGHWTNQFTHEDPNEPDDVVRRIIEDLFRHVYTMEQTMEINVSIKHIAMTATHAQVPEDLDNKIPKISNEHFVSVSKDVFNYMEKVMQRFLQYDLEKSCDSFAHVLFIINVTQMNLDKTVKLFGKLQLVHLMNVEQCIGSSPCFDDSPIREVFKIVKALANNPKTHLRYFNIRLTHLLKELLGDNDPPVIINYTEMPQFYTMLTSLPTSPVLNSNPYDQYAELWKELYIQERRKYTCLKEKVINLQFCNQSNISVEAKKLIEQLKILDQSNSEKDNENNNTNSKPEKMVTKIEQMNAKQSEEIIESKTDSNQNNELCSLANEQKLTEPLQMHQDIEQIQLELKNFGFEMLELQVLVQRIEKQNKHNEQQLKEKDLKLLKLNELVVKANKELDKQKIGFLQMLTEYSEMHNRLWQNQYRAMEIQGKQHERQLTKMFDSLYEELHHSHRIQLVKLKQQLGEINKPVTEKDPTTSQP